MNHCGSEHEQIIEKLNAIDERLNKDWPLIEAAHKDLVGRQMLWDVLKLIGFSGATFLLGKFFG
jgi:hypothetical protein